MAGARRGGRRDRGGAAPGGGRQRGLRARCAHRGRRSGRTAPLPLSACRSTAASRSGRSCSTPAIPCCFSTTPRMATAVGAALRLPLTGPELAAAQAVAARSMERPRATDRERAAAYLETLFLAAGVPAGRLEEVRDTLARLHGEAPPLERHRGRHPRRARAPARGRPPPRRGLEQRRPGGGGARGRRPPQLLRRGRGFGPGRDGKARSRYLPIRARRARRRRRPRPCTSATCMRWTWSAPTPPGIPAVLLVTPGAVGSARLRHRRLPRRAGGRTAQGEIRPHDGCPPSAPVPPVRCRGRSGCSSPSRGSTATTAAPRWWPRRCATREWKWCTPGCTRRPR